MQRLIKITDVTRQHIADEMAMRNIWYHGNQNEPDFLTRLFDLKHLPSRDYRYSNAYDDIYQHMVNNSDWDPDWIYSDSRIDLLHCEDDLYLRFLAATLHPRVRSDAEEISFLFDVYNNYLSADGFELIQNGDISGCPVFVGRERILGDSLLEAKKIEIKRYLNSEYVRSKIGLMTDAIKQDTDLAIGIAKELIETTCKSILIQNGITIDSDWTLPQLLKTTNNSLDFAPKAAANPEKAEKGVKQILNGIATIVHGISEIRNSYGSGHGKESSFKGLETKYAKLLVGLVSEISIFYLTTNGETAELIE